MSFGSIKLLNLFSLLKTAANAVLKLISAVLVFAPVLSVSTKAPSVSVILLEFLRSTLKYDSTNIFISVFHSVSRTFFFIVSNLNPHSLEKSIQRRLCRLHIRLGLNAGTESGHSGAAQEESCLSFEM